MCARGTAERGQIKDLNLLSIFKIDNKSANSLTGLHFHCGGDSRVSLESDRQLLPTKLSHTPSL